MVERALHHGVFHCMARGFQLRRSVMMRKALYVFPIVAAAVLATPALAQPYGYDPQYNPDAPAATVTGTAVGTAAGVAIYNGALGSGAFAAALPTTAAGAAAVGGVAGVGTIALVDAVVQPCRGFQALFLMHREECANAEWGNTPRRRIAQR
jgi:hypothetical protein